MGSFDKFARRAIKKSQYAAKKKKEREAQEEPNFVASGVQFNKDALTVPAGMTWEGGALKEIDDDEKKFACKAGCGKKFYGFTDHDKHIADEHGGEGSTGIVVR
jgi:hypothetical protein